MVTGIERADEGADGAVTGWTILKPIKGSERKREGEKV